MARQRNPVLNVLCQEVKRNLISASLHHLAVAASAKSPGAEQTGVTCDCCCCADNDYDHHDDDDDDGGGGGGGDDDDDEFD